VCRGLLGLGVGWFPPLVRPSLFSTIQLVFVLFNFLLLGSLTVGWIRLFLACFTFVNRHALALDFLYLRYLPSSSCTLFPSFPCLPFLQAKGRGRVLFQPISYLFRSLGADLFRPFHSLSRVMIHGLTPPVRSTPFIRTH